MLNWTVVENNVFSLRHDNDDLKYKLKALNEMLSKPSEEVLKLEKKINSIKVFVLGSLRQKQTKSTGRLWEFPEYLRKTHYRGGQPDSAGRAGIQGNDWKSGKARGRSRNWNHRAVPHHSQLREQKVKFNFWVGQVSGGSWSSFFICLLSGRSQTDSTETRVMLRDALPMVASVLDEQQQQSQNEEIEKAIQKIYKLKHVIETNAIGLNFNMS
jgi:hypothetical protein